jgi:hypothetical protein
LPTGDKAQPNHFTNIVCFDQCGHQRSPQKVSRKLCQGRAATQAVSCDISSQI